MSGVQDGLKEGEKELDECYTFTTDELTAFLQTIPGIGQKIAQLVIIPVPMVILEEVNKLEETERGDNGFGSTGKF